MLGHAGGPCLPAAWPVHIRLCRVARSGAQRPVHRQASRLGGQHHGAQGQANCKTRQHAAPDRCLLMPGAPAAACAPPAMHCAPNADCLLHVNAPCSPAPLPPTPHPTPPCPPVVERLGGRGGQHLVGSEPAVVGVPARRHRGPSPHERTEPPLLAPVLLSCQQLPPHALCQQAALAQHRLNCP